MVIQLFNFLFYDFNQKFNAISIPWSFKHNVSFCTQTHLWGLYKVDNVTWQLRVKVQVWEMGHCLLLLSNGSKVSTSSSLHFQNKDFISKQVSSIHVGQNYSSLKSNQQLITHVIRLNYKLMIKEFEISDVENISVTKLLSNNFITTICRQSKLPLSVQPLSISPQKFSSYLPFPGHSCPELTDTGPPVLL